MPKHRDFPLNVLFFLGITREEYNVDRVDITATLYYLLHTTVSTEKHLVIFLMAMRDHVPYDKISAQTGLSEGRISQVISAIIRKLREEPGKKEMLRLGLKRYHEIQRRTMQESYKKKLKDHQIVGVEGVREFDKRLYVGDLPVTMRALKTMKKLGAETVGDLLKPGLFSAAKVKCIYGAGVNTYNEICDLMVNHLGANPEDWPKSEAKHFRKKN